MDIPAITPDDLKLLRRLSAATKGQVPVDSLFRVAVLAGLEYLANTLLPPSGVSKSHIRMYREKLRRHEIAPVKKCISENWERRSDEQIGLLFQPAISAKTIAYYRRSMGLERTPGRKPTLN